MDDLYPEVESFTYLILGNYLGLFRTCSGHTKIYLISKKQPEVSTKIVFRRAHM